MYPLGYAFPRLRTPALDHILIRFYSHVFFFFFIGDNMTSHNLIVLSLLSERREMRVFPIKCHPGFGCRIKPRSSHTEVVCSTDVPLHIVELHIRIFQKTKKQKDKKDRKTERQKDILTKRHLDKKTVRMKYRKSEIQKE